MYICQCVGQTQRRNGDYTVMHCGGVFFPNLEFRVRLEKHELSSNFFSPKIKIFSKVCINIMNNMY